MLWEINDKLPFEKQSVMAHVSTKKAAFWRAKTRAHREALETFAERLGKDSFDAIVDRLKHTPYANRRLKGVPLSEVGLDGLLASIVETKWEAIHNDDLAIAKVVLDVIDAVFCPDVQANAPRTKKSLQSNGYHVTVDFDYELSTANDDVVPGMKISCKLFQAIPPNGYRRSASVIIELPSDTAVELKGNLYENIAMAKERLAAGAIVTRRRPRALLVQLLKMSGLFHSSAGQLYVSSGFADLCSV